VLGDDPDLAFEAAVLVFVLRDLPESGDAAVVSTLVRGNDP
jgi:hypothetical protein